MMSRKTTGEISPVKDVREYEDSIKVDRNGDLYVPHKDGSNSYWEQIFEKGLLGYSNWSGVLYHGNRMVRPLEGPSEATQPDSEAVLPSKLSSKTFPRRNSESNTLEGKVGTDPETFWDTYKDLQDELKEDRMTVYTVYLIDALNNLVLGRETVVAKSDSMAVALAKFPELDASKLQQGEQVITSVEEAEYHEYVKKVKVVG